MSSSSGNINQTQDFGMRLVYWLTVFMVIVGLVNMTPGIPGYDDLVQSITGIRGATFRKFPFEWFVNILCPDDAYRRFKAFSLAKLVEKFSVYGCLGCLWTSH